MRALSAALLALALGACAKETPSTDVLVNVSADDEQLAQTLSTIRAQVFAADAHDSSAPHQGTSFTLAHADAQDGQVTLPFSFAIKKTEADKFLLVITGFRADENAPAIERKVIASFRDRQTLALDVVLQSACLDHAQECASLAQTCAVDEPSEVRAEPCGPVGEAEVRPISPDGEPTPPVTEPDAAVQPARDADGGGELDAGRRNDLDAGLVGLDADRIDTIDGEVPDAGKPNLVDASGDAAPAASAVARAGTSCSSPGARACDAHNGRQRLTCFNGQWSLNGSCDGNTRCQTKLEAADVGSCSPVVSGCTDKAPGAAVCDGSTRRACGEDLLDYAPNPCPAQASCRDQSGTVSCICNTPYVSDGMGGCTVAICLQMPCMNGGACSASGSGRSCDCSATDYQGASCETKIDNCALTPCPRGTCTDGLRSRSCDCANTGFSGATCTTNVNECAGSNACSGTRSGIAFSYPCVDATGNTAGYNCPGQFADWPVPRAAAGRFSASAGVVTDAQTGLRWQQALDAMTYTQASAKAYCSTLPLAGGGWRLPTRAELLSIVDYAQYNPAIDPTAFPSTPTDFFWTSSAAVGTPGYGWFIYFANGGTGNDAATGSYRVRCVR